MNIRVLSRHGSLELGVWTEYDSWSSCSVTCGEGFQYRKRDCRAADDETRKIAHELCVGKHIEIRQCDVTTCPSRTRRSSSFDRSLSCSIAYGPWTTWTPCSTFCGIGVKQRNRSCVPAGSNCGNYTYEQRACGEANCQRVAGQSSRRTFDREHMRASCRYSSNVQESNRLNHTNIRWKAIWPFERATFSVCDRIAAQQRNTWLILWDTVDVHANIVLIMNVCLVQGLQIDRFHSWSSVRWVTNDEHRTLPRSNCIDSCSQSCPT
jgi:hypothetical protein